jgi:hypothetical protein
MIQYFTMLCHNSHLTADCAALAATFLILYAVINIKFEFSRQIFEDI